MSFFVPPRQILSSNKETPGCMVAIPVRRQFFLPLASHTVMCRRSYRQRMRQDYKIKEASSTFEQTIPWNTVLYRMQGVRCEKNPLFHQQTFYTLKDLNNNTGEQQQTFATYWVEDEVWSKTIFVISKTVVNLRNYNSLRNTFRCSHKVSPLTSARFQSMAPHRFLQKYCASIILSEPAHRFV